MADYVFRINESWKVVNTRVLRIVLRSVILLDPGGRRGYFLTAPLALALTAMEMSGFIALAAVVQVLATPALLAIAPPTSLVGILQTIVAARSVEEFIAIVGGLAVGILISRGAAVSFLSWWQAGLLVRAEANLSARLFNAYMGANYEFHLERHSADLIRTVAHSVRSMIGRVLLPGVTIITETTLVVGLAAGLLVMEPLPALGALTALALAMTFYLLVVRKKAGQIGVEDERLNARDHCILQEGLGTVKVLTILERRQRVTARFAAARLEHTRAIRGLMVFGDLSRYYLEAIILLVMAAAVGMAVIGGEERVLASIGVLLAGTMRLLPSAQRLMTALNMVQVGGGCVASVERDLAIARTAGGGDELAEQDRLPVTFAHTLELRKLSYQYPAGPVPALRSISLRMRFGESVGIVGASGAGKSTLVDVLIGLLPPTAGGVYVDGVKLTPAHQRAWRTQIGYVPQETVIIDDTVRRNVALGLNDDEIDDAAVTRALAQAQLLDTVRQLPTGLDSKLGELGARLSGGQRQRIGIARALYSRPKVLVLDEATAALDTVTERQIATTIEQLYGQITVIIVAHRATTVQRCDTRVLLSEGTVVTVGGLNDTPVRLRPLPIGQSSADGGHP